MTRRPGPAPAAVLLLSGLLVASAAPAGASSPRDEGILWVTAGDAQIRVARAGVHAPLRPPAPVCGSAAIRRGQPTSPPGAVVVRPSQRLDRVVARHRAGTTFWLRPGRYTLGKGGYTQVEPRSHDRIVGAPGVVLDGRETQHYAFGGKAVGVALDHLTIEGFGSSLADDRDEGVVNHDAGHRWHMRHLTVRGNAGAGVFIGSGDVLRDSCLVGNGQYGFSAYEEHGVRNVVIRHNEVAHNNRANWETRRPGCGCSGGAKFWDVRRADVVDNYVHDNRGVGLWADTDNTGFLFRGNYLAGNTDSGLVYEISYNAHVIGNTFVHNGVVDGPGDDFPEPALYVSESGSDRRAGARFGGRFLISRNRFVDNFSGVILWENADRFAGSPNNSSSDYTTLVNPKVATVKACGTPAMIRTRPYIDDCRWKTRQVSVVHNTFVFRPGNLGRHCTVADGCGFVGVFSQWGTSPTWSPYQGRFVENHITFHQGNRFRANRYVGPWRFMARELGQRVSWRTWRSAPYAQDAASTLRSS